MDIFAHALWAGAGAKKLNDKFEIENKPKVSPGWTAFWGVFPDFFAFTIPFMTMLYVVAFKGFNISDFRGPQSDLRGFEEMQRAFDFAPTLYQYSHSLIIFLTIFILTWIYFKRPRFELLGWALHILIDIFSHSAEFYPTPLFFPLSDWKFLDGVSWGNTYYMIINYSLLLLMVLYFIFRKKKLE
ncbi:MAG: hypothetical protein AAB438_02355 [Patescibacteria group bacterium]